MKKTKQSAILCIAVIILVMTSALFLFSRVDLVLSIAETKTTESIVVNNIVIYVNFTDSPTLTSSRKLQVTNVFSKENKDQSFYHSIKTLSNNKLIYETTYVEVTLETKASDYYTKTSDSHPITANNLYKSIVTAVTAASNKLQRNLDYDAIITGGIGTTAYQKGVDGKIDSMMFVYNTAETFGSRETDWGTLLWPSTISYTSALGTVSTQNGNKSVYTVIGMPLHMIDHGVTTHETLHSLGMQDLYPYNNATGSTDKTAPVGIWDIMANGSGSSVNGVTYYNMLLNNYSRYWLRFIDDTQFKTMQKNSSETVTFSTSLSQTGTTAFKFGERTFVSGGITYSEFFVAEYRNFDEKIIDDSTVSLNGAKDLVKKANGKAKAGFVFYKVNTRYEKDGNRNSVSKTMQDSFITFLRDPTEASTAFASNFNATFATSTLLGIPDKLPAFKYSNGETCSVTVTMTNYNARQLTFSEGFKYSGIVQDYNGNAITQANVLKNGTIVGTTDANGKFTISAVVGDKITFAKDNNYKFTEYTISLENNNQIFKSTPATATTTNCIIKNADGITLEGVSVFASGVEIGKTAIDGSISVTVPPLTELTFIKKGYTIGSLITNANTTRAEVSYDKNVFNISGSILLGTNGIDGVEVWINGVKKTETDINGKFVLDNVEFNTVIDFRVDGYIIPSCTVEVATHDLQLVATLAPLTVGGIVKGLDDLPLGGVEARVNGKKVFTTNSDGVFSIQLYKGDTLSFYKKGYVFNEYIAASDKTDVIVKTKSVLLDFEIGGEIVYKGKPLAQVKVKINGIIVTETDADGHFKIVVMEDDELSFEKSGYEFENIDVNIANKVLNITATKAYFIIDGEIKTANGIAIGGVKVSINGTAKSITGNTGKYQIKVQLGDKLTFTKDSYTFDSISVEDISKTEYDANSTESLFKLVFKRENGEWLSGLVVMVNGESVGATDVDGEISLIATSDDVVTYEYRGDIITIDDIESNELEMEIIIDAAHSGSNETSIDEPKNIATYVIIGMIVCGILLLLGIIWTVSDKKR